MAKPTVTEVYAQINTHEAVCAERWGETLWRLKRLEQGALYAVSAVIGLLVSIIFLILG